MNYLKYTAYVYLAAAAFFIVHGIKEYNAGTPGSWLSFFLAAMAVFMFFFRQRFSRKMANRQDRRNGGKDNRPSANS